MPLSARALVQVESRSLKSDTVFMELLLAVSFAACVVVAVLYMRAQKPQTDIQNLIHQERYAEAISEADRLMASKPGDAGIRLHRAEAAKLMGNFEEALRSYREAMRLDDKDPSSREGIALALTYLDRAPEEARALMEETIAGFPAIQEFQALALAYILLRQKRIDEAFRLFDDNLVLLQTRFEVDYTDRDPLLAETLYHFAVLSQERGDLDAASELRRKVRGWAPKSVFATWATEGRKA